MNQASSLSKFLLFLLVNLVVHLPFLNMPPSGSHVWRQCNTLAMSRNFATEDMNIFKPHIDRRNETDGLTGSHFPLYEWLLALISKAFGFSETLARFYSLIISSLGMLAFYLILTRLKAGIFYATCGAVMLLSVPQIFYDSINAMPDILALTLSLFSLYFFLSYLQDKQAIWVIPAILFGLLGGLVKFQFLIIPFASIAFIRFNLRQIITAVVAVICIAVPIVLWYRHALELTNVNNLREFGLWIQPISLQEKLDTFYMNLISDLPELLMGWPVFVCFVIVMVFNFTKTEMDRERVVIWLWALGFIVFYIIAIERMRHHSYYFISLIPLFIIVLIRYIKHQEHSRLILIWILALNFTWSCLRIIPTRWTLNTSVPVEFLNKDMRMQLQKSIPAKARCVVGPDISGCVYFYFTDTKGYSFADPSELLEIKAEGPYFEVMRSHGVKYLICNEKERMDPVLKQLPGIRLKSTIGEFQVWEIL
jgi:uncharacterized membrane protein (UPF0136 family)